MEQQINVIRPIASADLELLYQIAQASGPGFTSLPTNRELLAKKIAATEQALSQDITSPAGESYLFVMEQGHDGKVIGVCGIEAAVGLMEPFYHYRIGTVVHASRELGVHNTFQTLYLCNDYTGSSEVCTLFLEPDSRHSKNGSLLSKSRFLFMAQFPHRFTNKVIAEMRGVSNGAGRSPFWDGLGKHFFSMEFSEADYLTGIGNKVFIAELMPKHSIYMHLLPEPAQQVIGQVHQNTIPARRMLENEGFRYEGYVDIFDAGPTLACDLNDIRAVRDSDYTLVHIGPAQAHSVSYLISNTSLTEFRCTMVNIGPSEGQITLPAEIAHLLKVKQGDRVRVVELKAPVSESSAN
ncbi:arginine N-succinyltransferase [Amphritea sp. HPY]|uniref:arginine N-succinyltransferase n=1 Tax=Amphritea sp. HPY TaxID=3421652 RepID=UPI003D7CC4EF